MRAFVAVLGVLLVVGVFLGMVDTLISTRFHLARRRRFSTWLPRVMWPVFRRLGSSARTSQGREAILSSYPPLVLLALIMAWVGLQVLGWAMVWWGTGLVDDVTTLGESLYYSGIVYFTIGFGDFVPVAGTARVLALVEGFVGVLFIALTVGYLPSLYSNFAARERLLLTVDDGGGDRITPLSLMLARLDGSTDLHDLDPVLSRWEDWVAGVMESHTSHPMLSYFRSQHPGQSWVTAMGLMADVALWVIVLTGRRSGPAWHLYRRIVRTVDLVVTSLRLEPADPDGEVREAFRTAVVRWQEAGFELPEDHEAMWQEWHALRAAYAGPIAALVDHLDAPRGFWGHTVGVDATGSVVLVGVPTQEDVHGDQ